MLRTRVQTQHSSSGLLSRWNTCAAFQTYSTTWMMSNVHPVGGGARFHQVELRLGAVDEHDPALDVLGVLALGFQRRLGNHLPGLAFEARPDPFGHQAGPHGPGLGPGLGLPAVVASS